MFFYTFFYCGALIFFALMVNYLLAKGQFSPKFSIIFLFIYVVSMFMIAHLLHFIFVEHSFSFTRIESVYAKVDFNDFSNIPLSIFSSLAGFWGGPWAVLCLLFIFIFFLKIDLELKKELLDVFAVVFPFALAICKLGCFGAGCCYGFSGHGFPFVNFFWVSEIAESYGKTLFPVQLLDALLFSINGIILVVLFRKGKQKGRLILWFILMYALGRFFTEFMRGDQPGTSIFGLRLVQFILIFAFAMAVFMLIKRNFYEAFFRVNSSLPDQKNIKIAEISSEHKRYKIFYGFMMIFCVLIPFFLVICIIPFCINCYKYYRNRRDAQLIHQIFRLFILFALGLLALTGFFVVSIFPLMVMLLVLISFLIFLMNHLFFKPEILLS